MDELETDLLSALGPIWEDWSRPSTFFVQKPQQRGGWARPELVQLRSKENGETTNYSTEAKEQERRIVAQFT